MTSFIFLFTFDIAHKMRRSPPCVVELGWRVLSVHKCESRIPVRQTSCPLCCVGRKARSYFSSQIASGVHISVSVSKEMVASAGWKKLEKIPGRLTGVIPAGTYKGQVGNKDVTVGAATMLLVVRKGLSNELVYRMTKAF